MLTVTGPIPDTENSVAYRTFAQDESELLESYNYERQEYFISGSTSDGPFKTRIMIAKPKDPSKSSGNVITEIYQNSVWGLTCEYIMRSGHIWVMISSRGEMWLDMIKRFDKSRYESLYLPDAGLNPEILYQVVALLRQHPSDLIPGHKVNKSFLVGYSGDGAAVREFIEKYHEQAKLADGQPVFDGYLVAATAVGSAPRPIPDIDVPVIETMNENEAIRSFQRGSGFLAYRRPDGKLYRLYEIAGAGHINTRRRRGKDRPLDLSACVESPASQFPVDHVYSNALHRLLLWANDDIEPPYADRIAFLPDGKTIARDEHGNALGGVRSTHLDVPFAAYAVISTKRPGVESRVRCEMIAHIIPFTREKLENLYQNKAGYVSRVEKRIDELVRDGWYLEADAEEIKREAEQFSWPDSAP